MKLFQHHYDFYDHCVHWCPHDLLCLEKHSFYFKLKVGVFSSFDLKKPKIDRLIYPSSNFYTSAINFETILAHNELLWGKRRLYIIYPYYILSQEAGKRSFQIFLSVDKGPSCMLKIYKYYAQFKFLFLKKFYKSDSLQIDLIFRINFCIINAPNADLKELELIEIVFKYDVHQGK